MSSPDLIREAPACAGPDRTPRTPQFVLPPNTCDTHAHVFGPRTVFPFSSERNYTPEDCTVDDYAQLLARLGIDRCVVVQGGAHGTDNRVTVDAIARLGARARGVAVIRPGLSRGELRALHEGGIRGCRLSTVVRGGAGFQYLEALARETADFGWHLVLHLRESAELMALSPRLLALPNPIVLDHLGHVLGREGESAPGFAALLRLLETDRCWVKLASLYRSSSMPYPHDDMTPLVRRLLRERVDRVIWGTNWPHPIYAGPMPHDADLVDLIPRWMPSAIEQQHALVLNPARLYGFA